MRRRNSVTPKIMMMTEISRPHGSLQSDVAEACRRQRRHREIQRVDVVFDLGIGPVLGLVDDGRHDEQKHGQMDDGDRQFLVAAKPWLSARSRASS